MSQPSITRAASSRGLHFNTGNGPALQIVDIGHADYFGVLDPDSAFWSLVKKDKVGEALTSSALLNEFREKRDSFLQEMHKLRFGLQPSAVYFNPTEECNLNCTYCYIPEDMRRGGVTMTAEVLGNALQILKDHFASTLPSGRKPQIVFHGAEPMIAREAMFPAMDAFKDDFVFGVQTNGTLLDDAALDFLTSRNIGVGLSLDGHLAEVADLTRKNWGSTGVFGKVVEVMDKLQGYGNYSVICTATDRNMRHLCSVVDFFHAHKVPVCMLNPVRCTRQGARDIKPRDEDLARYFLAALDRTHELYRETGRKLVVMNFANILISIIAPLARRLMCDISPCGGGRCFFALGARGDLFPCSEFVGLPEFDGGNLFKGELAKALESEAFKKVTGRKVEDIEPCARCAIRHFCGSPCPAEAFEMNGGMDRPGAFCELYEEQVRYAFRLIADGKEQDYLWDGWDEGTETTMEVMSL